MLQTSSFCPMVTEIFLVDLYIFKFIFPIFPARLNQFNDIFSMSVSSEPNSEVQPVGFVSNILQGNFFLRNVLLSSCQLTKGPLIL